MRTIWLLVMAMGCGGGISGEPMEGTITMQYGDSAPMMVVGAAVQHENADDMLVQIGSDNVDCDTYLDVFFDLSAPSGHFVYFAVPKLPGAYDQQSVSVDRNTNRDFRSYESLAPSSSTP